MIVSSQTTSFCVWTTASAFWLKTKDQHWSLVLTTNLVIKLGAIKGSLELDGCRHFQIIKQSLQLLQMSRWNKHTDPDTYYI